MTGKVVLVGSNKCPICGKEFLPIPPLRPNVSDREFYGGRIAFFKTVECDCKAKYDLCIEKRFTLGEDRLEVINMIVLKEGIPLDELRKMELEEAHEEAEAKAVEAVHQAIVEEGDVPTLKQRQEIKRQTILATIVDSEQKINTLTYLTIKELRTMCKRRRIKFNATENKRKLAEKLIADDPSLVIADPKDQV